MLNARIFKAVFFASISTLLFNQAAWAFSVGPLTLVSNSNQLIPNTSSCTANDVGTLYRQAEVEPNITVGVSNTNLLLASWQQNRWNNGGSQDNLMAFSTDGGANWIQSAVPFQKCIGGVSQRASDPWGAISANGKFFINALYFNFTKSQPAQTTSGMYVSRGTLSNDGQSIAWETPVILGSEVGPDIRVGSGAGLNAKLLDKNTLIADYNDPTGNTIYAIWDNAPFITGKSKIQISITRDGGDTWSTMNNIYSLQNTSNTGSAIGSVLGILPKNFGGTLIDAFVRIYPVQGTSPQQWSGGANSDSIFDVAIITSKDQGKSWSKAKVISRFIDAAVSDPLNGDPVRTGDIVPAIAVNKNNGRVYIAWQQTDVDGGNAYIVVSVSTDGGATWSKPVKVSRTPSTAHAFSPSIAVTDANKVVVTYYDFRNSTSSSLTTSLNTDFWMDVYDEVAVSGSGTAKAGLQYSTEVRLTDSSFNLRKAPLAGGYFLGDYTGLITQGNSATAVFASTDNSSPDPIDPSTRTTPVLVDDNNRTDIYSRTVSL